MAASNICGKVISDFLFDCNDTLSPGIEQEIYIGNRCDINQSTLTIASDLATGTHSITTLEMETGTKLFRVQGVPGKNIFTAGYTMNDNDDSANDWVHSLNLRAFNLNEASLSYLNNLASGADLFAIVPTKNDFGVDAFKVFGLDAGLKAVTIEYASQDNKGATIYTLSSRDPDFEYRAPYIYKLTDYAATKANIEQVLTVPAV